MINYPAGKIRNITLLGHGGSGKTALAEAMLYSAKAVERLGRSADGNTAMDFHQHHACSMRVEEFQDEHHRHPR